MFDFFNEFFRSELAKNHVVAFIVSAVLLIGVGAILMWLYMSKIKMNVVLNKQRELKEQVADLTNQRDSLQKELTDTKSELDNILEQQDKLRYHEELTFSEQLEKSDYIDSALEKFTKK